MAQVIRKLDVRQHSADQIIEVIHECVANRDVREVMRLIAEMHELYPAEAAHVVEDMRAGLRRARLQAASLSPA